MSASCFQCRYGQLLGCITQVMCIIFQGQRFQWTQQRPLKPSSRPWPERSKSTCASRGSSHGTLCRASWSTWLNACTTTSAQRHFLKSTCCLHPYYRMTASSVPSRHGLSSVTCCYHGPSSQALASCYAKGRFLYWLPCTRCPTLTSRRRLSTPSQTASCSD